MTAFIARAAQVSTKLAEVLEKLLEMLKELKALKEAEGTWKAFKTFRQAKGIFQAAKALKEGDTAALGANRALHFANGAVKGGLVEPALSLAGLKADPGGGAKGILTGKDGLGAIATNIDNLTGTGKPGDAYHLPAQQLASELDNLTTLQPTEHKPLNLE